jgi:hypothetical protein
LAESGQQRTNSASPNNRWVGDGLSCAMHGRDIVS